MQIPFLPWKLYGFNSLNIYLINGQEGVNAGITVFLHKIRSIQPVFVMVHITAMG